MPLADLFKTGVAIAHKITNDGKLQETVGHRVFSSVSGSNQPTWAASVPRQAIVIRDMSRFEQRDEYKQAKAYVGFLQPVVVGPKDVIVLDGVEWPIIDVKGMTHVPTSLPLYAEVMLG